MLQNEQVRGRAKIGAAFLLALTAAACSPSPEKAGDGSTTKASASEPTAEAPAASARGPFGIAMGTPISKLKVEPMEGVPGGYTVASVPKPHSQIETVYVTAFPETGVCAIRGVGFTQDDDDHGVKIRSEVNQFAEQLKTKYGDPKKVDRCFVEYGCDSQFWTMKLKENARAYFYEWPKKEEGSYPDDVGDLIVGAVALNYSSSFVELSYYSNNHKRCAELEKAAKAEAL